LVGRVRWGLRVCVYPSLRLRDSAIQPAPNFDQGINGGNSGRAPAANELVVQTFRSASRSPLICRPQGLHYVYGEQSVGDQTASITFLNFVQNCIDPLRGVCQLCIVKTYLVMRGMAARAIQKRVGHTDLPTTTWASWS